MPFVTNPNDGVRIYFEVIGIGPPVVLLHDLATTSRCWYRAGYLESFDPEDDLLYFASGDALYLDDRSEHTPNYQLILIDARGHGKSDKPHSQAAHGGLVALATDVVAILDSLEIDRAHVIGYGMGAMTGYVLGRIAPERLHSLILGGGPRSLDDSWVSAQVEMFQEGPEAVVKWFESSIGTLQPDHQDEIYNLDMEAMIAAVVAITSESITDEFFQNFYDDDGYENLYLFVGDRDSIAYDQVKNLSEWLQLNEYMDDALCVLPNLDHIQVGMNLDQVLEEIRRALGWFGSYYDDDVFARINWDRKNNQSNNWRNNRGSPSLWWGNDWTSFWASLYTSDLAYETYLEKRNKIRSEIKATTGDGDMDYLSEYKLYLAKWDPREYERLQLEAMPDQYELEQLKADDPFYYDYPDRLENEHPEVFPDWDLETWIEFAKLEARYLKSLKPYMTAPFGTSWHIPGEEFKVFDELCEYRKDEIEQFFAEKVEGQTIRKRYVELGFDPNTYDMFDTLLNRLNAIETMQQKVETQLAEQKSMIESLLEFTSETTQRRRWWR